ncbi:MAG TPA: hypothetical protein VGN00_04295 [Puia sp.]
MRNTSVILLLAVGCCLCYGSVCAQGQPDPSPVPVFNSVDGPVIIFGGSSISSSGKDNEGTHFVLSRAEGNSTVYTPISLPGRVGDLRAFKKMTGQTFVNQLQHQLKLTSEDALWSWLVSHPDLSGYGLASFNIPFRVAMGAAYIDRDLKGQQNKTWSYKIDVDGKGNKASFTSSITIGQAPDFSAPVLVMARAGDSTVGLHWRLKMKKDIPFVAAVYRQEGGRGAFQLLATRIIATNKGDSATFIFTERVKPNSAYRYFIRPADLLNNAGLVNSDTASVVAANFRKLPFVSQLKAADTLNGILLSWKPLVYNPLITGIEIQRSRDSRGDYVIIDTVSALAGSYMDRRLLPHIAYYYRLCVLHAGKQLQSEKFYMVVSSDQQKTSGVPDAPYAITAVTTPGGVQVHWQPSASPDLYAYYVYRATSLAAKMEVISPALRDTVYTDTASNLSRQTSYVYGVTAVSNASKESPVSEKVSARLPFGKERPVTPGGIRVSSRQGRVLVEWEDVKRNDPGIAGYILYKHIAGNRQLQYDPVKPASQEAGRLQLAPVIAGAIGIPYFEDTLPAPGQRMEYLVSSIDVFGVESGLSPAGSAPVITGPALRPPAQLFARTVPAGVSLQWEQADLAGVEGFGVYRRVVSEKKAMRIALVSQKENQFTDRQARAGNLYVYTVTVLGAGGESAASDERTVRK